MKREQWKMGARPGEDVGEHGPQALTYSSWFVAGAQPFERRSALLSVFGSIPVRMQALLVTSIESNIFRALAIPTKLPISFTESYCEPVSA
jgi:hypothetical protein